MATREELYTALRNADQAGDTASAQKLAAYIQSLPAEAPAKPMTQGEEWMQAGKNVGSAIARPIAKGIAGLPLMAMDVGVGARNLTAMGLERFAPSVADTIYSTNRKLAGKSDFLASVLPQGPGQYDMPSQQFNQSLDQVTVAPEGFGNKAAEFVSSALIGSRLPAPQAAQRAPTGFVPPGQALRDAALARAQKEGYVVPPSSNNPTFANRMMEGIAGKAKLTQEAMMRNQPTTEGLAARALGQNPEVPITQGALAEIRATTVQAGYGPVRAAGEMAADSRFVDDLAGLTKVGEGATRMGVKSANPAAEVIAALKENKTFDASDGVDTIQYLRSLVDDAYGAGQKSVGKAYKSAAKALEDLIERNLAGRGKDGQGLLSGFRDARRLIAQTYTAGKALTDTEGTVNALSYANAVKKGLPLVGDQKTIGEFAARFGKFAGVPKEIYPSISPLDTYGSTALSLMSGNPAPMLLPLTRQGLREYLLSAAGQARAMPKAFAPPQTMGLMGAYPQLATRP